MKKLWKTLLIIVLIVASVAGTVYVFYKTFTRRQDSFAYINQYLVSSSTDEFNDKLVLSKKYADTRATVLIDTNEMFKDITKLLNGYMITAKDYNINENALIGKLNDVIYARAVADNELDQYIWKCKENSNVGAQFDKALAYNNSYKAVSNYLVKMSEFVKLLNDDVKIVLSNPDIDVKFAVIDIYSYASNNAFKYFNDEKVVEVKSSANMTWLNTNIKFNNGYLSTTNENGNYTENNNNFMTVYNKCDKVKFALNIAVNMNAVNEIVNSSSNEAKATYYLKQILGI